MSTVMSRNRVDVSIKWLPVCALNDPLWSFRGVLYAICRPRTCRILYIGKADYSSVRERFRCRSKDLLWNFLESEYGVSGTTLRVGGISTDLRLTTELLSDVESLLIGQVQPVGNIQAMSSRTSRPGLRVSCTGDWPHRKKLFIDRDMDRDYSPALLTNSQQLRRGRSLQLKRSRARPPGPFERAGQRHRAFAGNRAFKMITSSTVLSRSP